VLAFAHMPAGTAADKGFDIDELNSKIVESAVALTAIGADIEIGRLHLEERHWLSHNLGPPQLPASMTIAFIAFAEPSRRDLFSAKIGSAKRLTPNSGGSGRECFTLSGSYPAAAGCRQVGEIRLAKSTSCRIAGRNPQWRPFDSGRCGAIVTAEATKSNRSFYEVFVTGDALFG
jgi:hypothetical protein